MNNYIQIENRKIGDNYPPLIIAEIGINHGGSLELAFKMAEAAIESGAEVIKHQTHIPIDEMSHHAKEIIPPHTKDSIYSIIENCSLSEEEEFRLFDFIKSKNKIVMSTPFSRAAVDRLVKYGVSAFKIGSGECNNYPLIEYISKFSKPIILSTGMNSIDTILPSVDIIRKNNISFALLHCCNIYPTPYEEVRLDCITLLKKTFPDAVVGLSDHTVSNFTSFGAIALGASIIERHFTDSMNREGPDIVCSMNPDTLKELIEGSIAIYKSRGIDKNIVEKEKGVFNFANSSVVSIKDIKKGDTFTIDNLWLKRPGNGEFHSKDFNNLLGKKSKIFIKKDSQIKSNDFN
ncbi:N-acetylneuraminate synthase family protein [Alphaproteobacteria bacterium]|nr:N-acetylneuraminate synthase family protein [Alphaproteobacteria bacterium]